jgi:hypothetical protein
MQTVVTHVDNAKTNSERDHILAKSIPSLLNNAVSTAEITNRRTKSDDHEHWVGREMEETDCHD